jgi:RHS repeat-associated protein
MRSNRGEGVYYREKQLAPRDKALFRFKNLCCSCLFILASLLCASSVSAQVNVAAQANGGTATASTAINAITFGSTTYTFPPSGAINGDRKGLNWGSGDGWNDETPGTFPDWLQVNFSGMQTIGEIDVFTVQDNYTAPIEPTTSMTFSRYGITDFQVQYWSGSAWQDVPGANVTGNNLVWRRFTFAPITTDRIRVVVNAALETYSRIIEVEAWTVAGTAFNRAPTINLTAPAINAMFSVPATVDLSATAADPDGSVSKVEFYRDGTLIATVTSPSSGAYTFKDASVGAGSYSYVAKVYDNATPPAVATSAARLANVTATPKGALNVAALADGAVATSSTAFTATFDGTTYTFPPSGAIDGDRKGAKWGFGGGWNDTTPNAFPDWLQVNFSGTQAIGEINVFTVQDDYTTPVEPTASMAFSRYGITDFQVQYWNGTAWLDVPGGNVTGNNLVWRRFTFPAITTDRIRVVVNGALESYSRIIEVEAWTTASVPRPNVVPTIELTAPADNTMLAAPAAVNLSALAADSDGSVSKVEFYRNDALIGTVTAPVAGAYTYTDANVAAGTYSYVAKAYDDATSPAVKTSVARLVNVSATAAGAKNVAAQANGGVATASTAIYAITFDSTTYTFPPSAVIDGDRKGVNWGFGGGWNDETPGAFPDWVQVNFSGMQTIGEIDVFTVQDNYTAPAEPSSSMTFAKYGITDFQVQYWTGTAWQDVPGGNVTGNALVWRRFTFAPITTDRIRVVVNGALETYSRIIELEAWTAPNLQPAPSKTQTYYIHADHLNTPRVISNSARQVIWRWDNLDPFGVNAPDENPGGIGTFTCNLRFPGQYFDRETNLHYNYFRDYDSVIGRYIQSDPVGLAAGVNTYAYALNNPISKRDFYGLDTCGSGILEGLVPDNPFLFPFSSCCRNHDNCYDNCWSTPAKAACDDRFCGCMKSRCQQYGYVRAFCQWTAQKYCDAAVSKGQPAFDDARKKCKGPACPR